MIERTHWESKEITGYNIKTLYVNEALVIQMENMFASYEVF